MPCLASVASCLSCSAAPHSIAHDHRPAPRAPSASFARAPRAGLRSGIFARLRATVARDHGRHIIGGGWQQWQRQVLPQVLPRKRFNPKGLGGLATVATVGNTIPAYMRGVSAGAHARASRVYGVACVASVVSVYKLLIYIIFLGNTSGNNLAFAGVAPLPWAGCDPACDGWRNAQSN